MRLKGDEATNGTFLQQLADGLKVAVPAAVVEGNDEEGFALGEFAELLGLFASRGEGLVDDDVFAGFESLIGQREVRRVGRGDDDQLDGFVCQQLLNRARNPGCGIGFGGLVSLALHDGGETQARDRVDERRVKDASTQTEANYANANLTLCHYALPISLNAG